MTPIRFFCCLALLSATTFAAPSTLPSAPEKILLLPFEPINPQTTTPWIGRAVQQNLLAELSRLPHLQPLLPDTPSSTPITDPTSALRAGQQAQAKWVLFGSYQLLDPELRITGLILNTQTAQPVGGLSSTGSLRDLFAMEDTLSAQAKRILSPKPATVSNATTQPIPLVTYPILARSSPYPSFEGSLLQQSLQGTQSPFQSQSDRYTYTYPATWYYFNYYYGPCGYYSSYYYGYPYYYYPYYRPTPYYNWNTRIIIRP